MASPGPEDALKKRGRGRPKTTGLPGGPAIAGSSLPGGPSSGLSLNLLDLDSNTSGGSAPPTPNLAQPDSFLEDPLAMQEMEELGVYSVNDTLPPPKKKEPYAIAGLGIGAGQGPPPGAKRVLDQTPGGLFGRAKRPKGNIKFSPTKGKGLARRAPGTKGIPGPDGEIILPNNDFCDSCQGKGPLLCCDGGCLRSFHFTCLDPPIDMDEMIDEDSWYCKSCAAAKNPPPKPPRGFFRELIYKIDCENPKVFQLTPDLKGFYKQVASGGNGEFIDTTEHRPPSKITGRPVGQEDRDGFKTKDKAGRTIICYNCSEAASVAKNRKIISCDFCEQHWHLDCLNPPMTGMPPPTRKWMCPLHADHVVPKKRTPKITQTVAVTHSRSTNNGDIIILPRRNDPGPMDDYEDIVVNRIRYQVPEETVILDFWGRVNDGPSSRRGNRSPKRKQQAEKNQGRPGRSNSVNSVESPLTSLGDLSDADPPEVAKLGYSPYSTSKASRALLFNNGPRPNLSLDARFPTATALDGLAAVAEGYYDHFLEGNPEAVPYRPSGQQNGDYSDAESSNAGSHFGVRSSHSVDWSSDEMRFGKLKPRAVDSYGRPYTSLNGHHLKRLDADPNYRPQSRPSLPTSASVSARPGQDYAHAAMHQYGPSDNPLVPAPVPPFSRATAGTSWGRGAKQGLPNLPLHGTPTRSETAPLPSRNGPVELEVQSKEDLKALMHVRKLMAGTEDSKLSEETKNVMLNFLEGNQVIPVLQFIKPEAYVQPWKLPWEDDEPGPTSTDPAAPTAATGTSSSAAPTPAPQPQLQPQQAFSASPTSGNMQL